ncbi:hypothetical protein V8V91_27600 [Algoriphagus halophilus]|uniref:hypothetical protein n=1 Tax=Algoriphagus halophilus TaxID=226505 RepID=UPI00358FAB41
MNETSIIYFLLFGKVVFHFQKLFYNLSVSIPFLYLPTEMKNTSQNIAFSTTAHAVQHHFHHSS